MAGTHIGDVGEFGLIERVAQIVGATHPNVVVGVGDDVAVLDVGGADLLLATVDCQVEGVHFLRDAIPPHALGRRALAINLSDIAAMGGEATFALVSLVLPDDLDVAWVEAMYRGMREEADRAGLAIVGGNMARSPDGVIVDVTVLGRVMPEHLLLRSGARPGDMVLVTGTLGDAAAGLHLLLHPETEVAEAERGYLLTRLFTPTARLVEGRAIAQSGRATAMIDISDGLGSDVAHICERSRVGIRLWAERLPVTEAAQRVAEQAGQPAWAWALQGGEDYELCFTAPREAVSDLQRAVAMVSDTPVTVVGEVLPADAGRHLILPDGNEVPLEAGGWRHF